MSNPKAPRSAKAPAGQAYWLYGLHAARAALTNTRRSVRRGYATAQAAEKLADEIRVSGVKVEARSAQEISGMLTADAVHQGIALEVAPLPEASLEEYLQDAPPKPVVLLDQVTDPHNVGAILRSAAAFDAGAVITTRDHAPGESAVLAKASSGGIEIVPFIIVTNLTQCMEMLKKHGYWCLGLDSEAKQTLMEAKPVRKTALVLGAEGRGLRRLTAERCDVLVRLPISAQMESLNVSNAAAVALYALAQSG